VGGAYFDGGEDPSEIVFRFEGRARDADDPADSLALLAVALGAPLREDLLASREGIA
jgi:hypothetical protein